MKKKFNYVYITTNLVNGKQYIGDHSTNNLNDNYLGSGTLLKRSVNKDGNKNFKLEILEHFFNKKDAANSQEKYIKIYSTHISQGGYNISWKGGHQFINSISEETKEKIRKAHIGLKASIETREKMKKTRREQKTSAGEKNGMYGSSLYEKMLHKYGKELADIKYRECKIKNGAKQRLRKWSKETREKMLIIMKNSPKLKCPYCDKEMDTRNYHKYHGDKCKNKS